MQMANKNTKKDEHQSSLGKAKSKSHWCTSYTNQNGYEIRETKNNGENVETLGPQILLVGIQPCSPLKRALAVPQKVKHRVTIWPWDSTHNCIPQRIENRDSNKYLHTNIPSGTIHNSQKVETPQVSINWWADKQTVVSPNKGMLFSQNRYVQKHGWNVDTLCRVEEVRHKGSCIMWFCEHERSSLGRSVQTERRLVSGMGGGATWEVWGFLLDDGNVLKLVVVVVQVCEYTNHCQIVNFKMVIMSNVMWILSQ